jgi:hypothetical protein
MVARPRPSRSLRRDSKARVPFAIVAVLILALSVASTSYLAAMNRRQAEARESRLSLQRLNAIAEAVSAELESAAYAEGMRAVALATQFYANQSLIDGEFQEGFSSFIASAYPSKAGDCDVQVSNCSVLVLPSSKGCEDAYESVDGVPEDYSTEEGATNPGTVPDTAEPDTVEVAEVPAFYVVAGVVNVTVVASNGMRLDKRVEVEQEVRSPYPLLDAKLGTLEVDAQGEFSSVARTVRYVLTTVAQFRVLEGYGSGLADAPGSTAQIICMEDVELAVNLAVALELARRLRDVDGRTLASLGDGGALGSLVLDYVHNGTLDPADLVALYQGIGEREVPIGAILAQGFSAVLDQFVLKVLDYFGIMDSLNEIYGMVAGLVQEIDSMARELSEWIGGDDGEGRDAALQVRQWIGKTFADLADASIAYPPTAGSLPTGLVPHGSYANPQLVACDVLQSVADKRTYTSGADALVSEALVDILNATGAVIGTTHWLNVRQLDLALTTRTNGEAGLPGYMVRFNATDPVRPGTEALWEAFYADSYEAGENIVYSDLRDALKALCAYVAAEVAEFFAGEEMTLASYGGALHRCLGHYANDRDALRGLLNSACDRMAGLRADLAQFVSANYDELADAGSQVSGGTYSLVGGLVANATLARTETDVAWSYDTYNVLGHAEGYTDEPRPAFDFIGVPSDATARAFVSEENRATLSADWQPVAAGAFGFLADEEAGLVAPYSAANGYLVRALESRAMETGNIVVDMVVGAGYDWGLVPAAEQFVLRSVEGIVRGGEGANVEFRPMVLLDRPFALGTQGEEQDDVAVDVVVDPPYLMGEPGDPAESAVGSFNYNLTEPSGTHYTELLAFNARPFETTWRLSVGGSLNVSVASRERELLVNGSHVPTMAAAIVDLTFNLSICVYSGWNLSGVHYANSASLAEDVGRLADMVREFFAWALDTVLAPVKWLVDQVTKVVDLLSNFLNRLMSYAQRVLQFLSELVQMAAEMLQEFVKETAKAVLDSVLSWLIDWLPDGLSLDFELFGFRVTAMFDPESALGDETGATVALLVLNISGGVAGARMKMGITVYGLGENESAQSGSEYDVLMEANVQVGGFHLDFYIDPLMALRSHISEATGGGDGWGLEMALPEVERRYDAVNYTLQDVPGLGTILQNIYVPCLGIKANVNAGMKVLYTEPGLLPDHVVLNEAELNPRGSDNSTEWVELYNPFEEEMDVSGWSVSSTTNGTHGNRTITMPSGTAIEARGFLVVNVTDEIYDDEGTRLTLADAAGTLIDSTHWLKDYGGMAYGDCTVPETGGPSTWQRSPNAADGDIALDWSMRDGTPGEFNGAGNLTFKELVELLLRRAFQSAWDAAGEFRPSFDYFLDIASGVVHRFVEDVLDVVETSIVEVEFFIDVCITEASGSAGGGFRLSFVIEGGKTARQLLEWVIGALEAFAGNLFKPAAPAKYPRLAPEAPEHLYLRFEGYAVVGAPAMLRGASSGGEMPQTLKLVGRVEANVPALAALAGKDMGRWRINFGVYVENVPGEMAHELFGTPEDENVDVWILKGTAFEL